MKRSGIKRKTRVKPINAKRAAAKLLRNFGTPAFRKWTKKQKCAICGAVARQWWNRKWWGNDCAHTDARGMGGCGGDWTAVCTACPPCHDAGKAEGRTDLAEEHQRRWAER